MEIVQTIQSSINSLISDLIEFVPRLLGAAIFLLITHFISKVIARVVRSLGTRFGIDQLPERLGLADNMQRAGIELSGGDILERLIYWIVFINLLIVPLEILGITALVDTLRSLINYIPSVVSALITLIVGVMLGRFLGRTVAVAMDGIGVDFYEALGNIVQGLVVIIASIVALGQLGMDVTLLTNTFSTLLAIIAAAFGLTFALGGRDVAKNVLAGHYARDTYTTGDTIKLDGQEGVLEGIGTMNSEIDVDGRRVVVPNTYLTDRQVEITAFSDMSFFDDPPED